MTDAELDRALREIDLRLKARQTRWEQPKAIAMLLLAFAAAFAAGGIAPWLWPAKPQQITVRLEQPLRLEMQR